MNVRWLVETGVFEESDTALLAALITAGAGFTCFSRPLDLAPWIENEHYENECIVFRGSINNAKYLIKKTKFVPGVYCTFQNYACTNYYAILGKYLLNNKYIMLPFGELLRQRDFLYDTLAQDGKVFIRPSRSDKPFTGRLVHKSKFDEFLDEISYGLVASYNDIVVVAVPKVIQAEFRFVVVDGKVITGCQYTGDTVGIIDAWNLASGIATAYQPDSAFTIDICLTDAGYSLLELNSFSCAGLYTCDLDTVVREVSKVALEEWKSYV